MKRLEKQWYWQMKCDCGCLFMIHTSNLTWEDYDRRNGSCFCPRCKSLLDKKNKVQDVMFWE